MIQKIYYHMLKDDCCAVSSVDEFGCHRTYHYNDNKRTKRSEGRANLNWEWDGKVMFWHNTGPMSVCNEYNHGKYICKVKNVMVNERNR